MATFFFLKIAILKIGHLK